MSAESETLVPGVDAAAVDDTAAADGSSVLIPDADAAELRAQFQPAVHRLFQPRGSGWAPFEYLRTISVTHCRLDVLPPLGIVCPHLRELNVSFNRLRVVSPASLRGCDALTTVQLHANELLSLPEAVAALAGARGLATLTLFDNPCLQRLQQQGEPSRSAVAATASSSGGVITSPSQRVHSRLGKDRGLLSSNASSTDRWSSLTAGELTAAGLPPLAAYVVAACPRIRRLVIASPFAWALKRQQQQQQRHHCWHEAMPLADGGRGASSDITGDDVHRACVITITPGAAEAAAAWLQAAPAGRAFGRLLASMDASVATELASALADAAAYAGAVAAPPAAVHQLPPARRPQEAAAHPRDVSPTVVAQLPTSPASSGGGGYRVTFSGRILDGAAGVGTTDTDGLADGAVALRVHGDGCVECVWPEGGPALVVAVDEQATAALRAQSAGTATTAVAAAVDASAGRFGGDAASQAYTVTAYTRDQQHHQHPRSSTRPAVWMDGFGAGAVVLDAAHWCMCGVDPSDGAALSFERDGSWYVCGRRQHASASATTAAGAADAEVASMLAAGSDGTPAAAPQGSATLLLVAGAPEAIALLERHRPQSTLAGAVSSRGQAGADDDAAAVRCKLVCDAFPDVTPAAAAAAVAAGAEAACESKCSCERCGGCRPFAFRTPDGCYAWQLGSQLGVTYRAASSTLRILLACRALQYELAVFTAADQSTSPV